MTRLLVFSHGFGVRKDDRGLFTDIAAALPEYIPVLFDLHEFDDVQNTITVLPFSEQVKRLQTIVAEQRELYPDAQIDMIGHSQGSRIIALAGVERVRKTILLSPTMDMGIERTLARYREDPNSYIDLNGISRLARTDGSTTIVPAAYWRERKNDTSPMDVYRQLARRTQLTLIKALQDHVLGETSFADLEDVADVIELEGDHDFSGMTRSVLVETVRRLITES